MLNRPVVRDVMTTDVVTVHPDTTYKQIAELRTRGRRIVRGKARGDTAGELMSAPAITVSPYLKVAEAARILSRRGVSGCPWWTTVAGCPASSPARTC